MSLRDAWNEQAANWQRFASRGGPDHWFWHVNWPAFEALLPPPRRATLDLGCGEGRVGARLRELGHQPVGVDTSPALVAAARERDVYDEVVEADAAALPFAAGRFDLVVAFMSLQDIDDAAAAVNEAARVVEAGGVVAIATVHPYWSGRDVSSYFSTERYDVPVEREGVPVVFSSLHRSLEGYVALVRDAGLLIADLREPRPTAEQVETRPRWAAERAWPGSLHLLARKP